MKSKKKEYVEKEVIDEEKNTNPAKELSIDEQLELFAELLVEYYLNHLEDEN